MQFTVSMEGRGGQVSHEVTLNGLPYQPGSPCGVGWKKLVVQAEGAEPFETNCFIWYGGATFGSITLARNRGRMDLDFSPAVESVRIIGAEERRGLTNVTHESLSLPTGRYVVEARFARFTLERMEDVTRNQTTRVAIAPSLTALHLTSEPEKAEFELRSKGTPQVSVRGETPATITDLPAGDYELAIAREDYRKKLLVTLNGAKATNNLNVEFRYAKLSIASEPPDATISDGSKVLGRTPASLDLPPGSHSLQVAKDGYFGTNLDLTLLETDTRALSVMLVNVSFVEAIERARKHSFGGMDYDRALADLEQALRIKPGDATAPALKREIEFDRHLRKAWELERRSAHAEALAEAKAALKLNPGDAKALAMKADLEKAVQADDEQRAETEQAAAAARTEERRKRPGKLLQEVASRLSHHELFEPQVMRFNGSLDAVRAGVVRAFNRDKPEFTIVRSDRPDDDIIIYHADAKGFGWKQNVVVVVGKTADNEVVVAFKLFAFILGGNIQLSLSGLSEDSYKPKHPRYASAPGMASVLENNLARDTQGLRRRITEELRSP